MMCKGVLKDNDCFIVTCLSHNEGANSSQTN